MSEPVVWHTERLPPAQKLVWDLMGRTLDGFVLYGNAAIALRFGHRDVI
jgi:hypothetical protein